MPRRKIVALRINASENRTLHKALPKALANSLKKVVGKVAYKSQNAFVKGRKILSVVCIANKVSTLC